MLDTSGVCLVPQKRLLGHGKEYRVSKKKVAAKDITVEYLTGGVEAVEAMDKEQGPLSRVVLRGAMKILQDRGQSFVDLEKWCRESHGFGLNNRAGLRAPKIGEERRYRVQEARGGPFMKLPLRTLGVARGSFVRGRFVDGQIVVEAEPDPA
jgi:hypothetical protein